MRSSSLSYPSTSIPWKIYKHEDKGWVNDVHDDSVTCNARMISSVMHSPLIHKLNADVQVHVESGKFVGRRLKEFDGYPEILFWGFPLIGGVLLICVSKGLRIINYPSPTNQLIEWSVGDHKVPYHDVIVKPHSPKNPFFCSRTTLYCI